MGTSGATAQVHRRVRLLAVLHGARQAGLIPLPLEDLHNIAYFADALAPVWGLRIIDAQLLKKREGVFSPVLQHDLDLLVGQGVVLPTDVSHRLDADGSWRLMASYSLQPSMAGPILRAIEKFRQSAEHLRFVVELVHAMSALGSEGIARASIGDAAYGSASIDVGSVVNLRDSAVPINASARVALRFGTLLEEEATLTSPEMIHLYIRELYKRISDVA